MLARHKSCPHAKPVVRMYEVKPLHSAEYLYRLEREIEIAAAHVPVIIMHEFVCIKELGARPYPVHVNAVDRLPFLLIRTPHQRYGCYAEFVGEPLVELGLVCA